MGIIIYNGPSQLDDQPILGIVTGARERGGLRRSKNSKITDGGHAAQLWIIRADMHPADALKTGGDASICGDCKLRGENGKGRSCYVNMNPVFTLYRSFPNMEVVEPFDAGTRCDASSLVRLGAYGDPVALPFDVIDQFMAGARSVGVETFTGYTHQWRSAHENFRRILMASCESAAGHLEAIADGWRTFTLLRPGEKVKNTVMCPASAEAGYKTNCDSCGLCNGKRDDADKRKSIFIAPHGIGARNAPV